MSKAPNLLGKSKPKSLVIAVASNFYPTLSKITEKYPNKHMLKIKLSSGSSGKLFFQIVNNAPFDLFFSADQEKPEKLVTMASFKNKKVFPYAKGQLVLVHSSRNSIKFKNSSELKTLLAKSAYIALANPKFAPYGKSAKYLIDSLLIGELPKLLLGENVMQALHFVTKGHADYGLTAYSLVLNRLDKKSYQKLPLDWYPEIRQFAVILNPSPAVSDFLKWFHSEQSKKIIKTDGYGLAG